MGAYTSKGERRKGEREEKRGKEEERDGAHLHFFFSTSSPVCDQATMYQGLK